MRRPLESFVRRWWAGDAGVPGAVLSAALLPAELVYRLGAGLRNLSYDRGWLRALRPGIPVVSVGNLVVGGAGKTPVSGWIARILADAGRVPAVVSRGYGEDELRLHRRWNEDVPVYAARDRAEAVRLAAEEGRRCAVLDDGFQHRRVGRDLDLVLVPVEEEIGGRLLPRGPFREPSSALRRADRIVLTRRTAEDDRAREMEERIRRTWPDLPVSRLRLVPDGWSTVDGETTRPPTGPVLAVTGIARPAPFVELVEGATGSSVELMTFPDHHQFTAADYREIRRRAGSRTIATTEKDAVRIRDASALGNHLRVLRLRVEEEGEGAGGLRRSLLRATAASPRAGEGRGGPTSEGEAIRGSRSGSEP